MAFVHDGVAYSIREYGFSDNSVHSITVICLTTQYNISIPLEPLTDTPFYASYSYHLSRMNQKDASGFPHYLMESVNALAKIVCDKCREVFGVLTNPSSTTNLQDYIQLTTYRISLVRDERSNDGVSAKSSSDSIKSQRWGIASVKLSELDERAITVQRFNGKQLSITYDAANSNTENEIRTPSGQAFFFKPRYDLMSPEFARELSVLLQIADHRLHDSLKVSRLAGLVVLEDGSIAGMLLDWLSALPLADTSISSMSGYHKRWEEEVKVIVRGLHHYNIVWGDVNPHNILVDATNSIWIIDFGGNNNVEFIDEEIKDTKAGDHQGIQRLFTDWLPGKSAALQQDQLAKTQERPQT